MGIGELRKQIDEIDGRILDLLNRRAEIAREVGREKAKEGTPHHAPDREDEVQARLAAMNRGPFPSKALQAVYREIMSACLALEQPVRIAYLGPPATFTHQASLRRFGEAASYLPARSIPDVFAEVEKGNADYGVVPVENSTEGAVGHTLDMFMESDLAICGEIFLEISHHLLARSEGLDGIRRVYSHPHALAQSRKWLEAHLARAEVVEVSSTAAAAEMAAREPGAAAVAGEVAARMYDLRVLARRTEDRTNNVTRFLVLGRGRAPRTDRDKTSLICSIRDRVGALYHMLEPFAKNGINLTKIESRPSKAKVWEYLFYIDFEGNEAEPRVQEALRVLRDECVFLKVLGSYPKGDEN